MVLQEPLRLRLTQSSSVRSIIPAQENVFVAKSMHPVSIIDMFNGTDLTTVDATSLENMNTMREAAEDAETDDFDPQIDAASGATGAYNTSVIVILLLTRTLPFLLAADALQVGKIKNKVLKLTGEVQVLNIKIAQAQAKGEDTSDLESSLAEEQYVSYSLCFRSHHLY